MWLDGEGCGCANYFVETPKLSSGKADPTLDRKEHGEAEDSFREEEKKQSH